MTGHDRRGLNVEKEATSQTRTRNKPYTLLLPCVFPRNGEGGGVPKRAAGVHDE